MMHKPKAAITGVFGYLPADILTNADLEKMVDTSQDWILSRTGIRERHILKGENQGSSVMGIKAVEGLLAKTGLKATEIDVILCATTTPDMVFPATANIIAGEIGAINSFGYDVSAACSGFLFTLSTAAQFIESGRYKNVVVVGTDKMSSIVDYQDRSTCILFGDGAGAVLLQPTTNEFGIEDFLLRTDGSGQEYLNMKAGGSRRPASHQTVNDKQHYIYQEGSIVFKFAVTNMADIAAQIMEKNKLKGSDIAWLVPHQANRRIIDATANRMGLDHNRVMLNIDRYGNTTNASMPLCLWEYENQLKKGDKLILAAFGGGFTWGSMYLTWAI